MSSHLSGSLINLENCDIGNKINIEKDLNCRSNLINDLKFFLNIFENFLLHDDVVYKN